MASNQPLTFSPPATPGPSRPPSPVRPTTTFFTPPVAALKYSIHRGHDYLTDQFPDPISPMDLDTLAARRIHESYQRLQLHGFTTRQLRLIGCFSPPEPQVPNKLSLSIPFHRFWRLKQWSQGAVPIPIGGKINGHYDMQYPEIRRAMQPVLALATCILEHVFTTPWYFTDLSG